MPLSHATMMPTGLLLTAGMDPSCIARFCLFVAVLLSGSVIIAKVLKSLLQLPMIAGYIIGGIVLGPSVLNIARWPLFAYQQVMHDYGSDVAMTIASSDLFIFCIMVISAAFTVSYLLWIAGHETEIQDILHVGFSALSAGFLGAVLPIIMVAGAVFYAVSGWSDAQAFALGLIFAATSVSIPVAMLFSYNKMHLKSSKATLGAAVIDDIVAVILVSMFFLMVQAGFFSDTNLVVSSHNATLTQALVAMVVTFMAILLFGYSIIPFMINYLKRMTYAHLIPLVATLIMLSYFAFSEMIGGLAGITGAYFAGLFHRMGDKDHVAEKVIAPFVSTLLLPLFLCSIGLTLDVSLLGLWDWVTVCLLLIVAIISKMIACFISTTLDNALSKKQHRWKNVETYLFGASMVARGEVGLVVATILYGSHMLNQNQYSIAVVAIVLTTIAAPIMLSIGFSWLEKQAVNSDEPYTLIFGFFKILGTGYVFSLIKKQLEESKQYTISARMSENDEIINLDNSDLEIILTHDRGIIFKGDREQVKLLVAKIRSSLQHEVKQLLVP